MESQLNLFGEIDHVERQMLALLNLAYRLSQGRRHVTEARVVRVWMEIAHLDRVIDEVVQPSPMARFRQTRPRWATRRTAATPE